MDNKKEENKNVIEELESGTFGYKASIVFLIFIAFVIYYSVTR